jgi:hypothetical protein
MLGDVPSSFHVIVLEQVRFCSGATMRSVSLWDDLLLQLEELIRPERAPKLEVNKRHQDSHEELSCLSWAQERGCSRY